MEVRTTYGVRFLGSIFWVLRFFVGFAGFALCFLPVFACHGNVRVLLSFAGFAGFALFFLPVSACDGRSSFAEFCWICIMFSCCDWCFHLERSSNEKSCQDGENFNLFFHDSKKFSVVRSRTRTYRRPRTRGGSRTRGGTGGSNRGPATRTKAHATAPGAEPVVPTEAPQHGPGRRRPLRKFHKGIGDR